jgi:HEPN domain-containing protein
VSKSSYPRLHEPLELHGFKKSLGKFKALVEKFWFGKARAFLKVAKESKERYPWITCFASQQSVEFTIKGILMKYRWSYPFTNDLSKLLEALSEELSITVQEEIMKECGFLTSHYV